MSLQTATPVTPAICTPTTPMYEAFRQYDYLRRIDTLQLYPDYRAGRSWPLTRQRTLIRSLLSGVPVGLIVLNDRLSAAFREESGSPSGWTLTVIDGGARISTVLAFYAGELAVPATWFPDEVIDRYTPTDDGAYVTFRGLTPTEQERLRGAFGTWVIETRLPTYAQERDLFEMINDTRAGTPSEMTWQTWRRAFRLPQDVPDAVGPTTVPDPNNAVR